MSKPIFNDPRLAQAFAEGVQDSLNAGVFPQPPLAEMPMESAAFSLGKSWATFNTGAATTRDALVDGQAAAAGGVYTSAAGQFIAVNAGTLGTLATLYGGAVPAVTHWDGDVLMAFIDGGAPATGGPEQGQSGYVRNGDLAAVGNAPMPACSVGV